MTNEDFLDSILDITEDAKKNIHKVIDQIHDNFLCEACFNLGAIAQNLSHLRRAVELHLEENKEPRNG